MHIPDGFLDAKTAIACTGLAAAGIAISAVRSRSTLPPSRFPILGLSAAFIFAAQMVNFPVVAGTSGHLIGSMLAAMLVGPSAAVMVLTAVLIVQALLFADGGVLALGANILNMAVVAPVAGYSLFLILSKMIRGEKARLVLLAVSSWFSVVMASAVCSGELSWSGTAPWNIVFPAMVGIHSLIGIGEGIITMVVYSAVVRARPGLGVQDSDARPSILPAGGYALIVLIAVVLFLTPFASRWPDGLDRVAESFGFSSRAVATPVMPSWLADYRIPFIESPILSTLLAGAIGSALVFAIGWLSATALQSRWRKQNDGTSHAA
jgi:cobalt/nickel transport system permease protein